MRTLIWLQLMLCLRVRAWAIVTGIIVVLAFGQTLWLINHPLYQMEGINLWDFMMVSSGGVLLHDPLWRLFGWVSAVAPVLFLVHHLLKSGEGVDVFALARIGSRWRWWMSKSVTAAVLVVVYSSWYLLLHLVMGMCFFSMESNWSRLSNERYGALILEYVPASLFLMVGGMFITGLLAFALLAQTVLFVLSNSAAGFTVFTVLLISSAGVYMRGIGSRYASPFHYSSFADLISQSGEWLWLNYWKIIGFNLMFSLMCLGVCLILVRCQDLTSKND